MDLIQRAIDKHGARAVYEAAVAATEGDSAPLQDVGIIADTLGVAWATMRQAHGQMSAEEQVAEHWDVQQQLRRHDSEQE